MKGTITILGAMAVGLLSFDIIGALFHKNLDWTTIYDLAQVLGINRFPDFVSGALAAPGFLLFLVPALAFYLLILWIDHT